MTSSIMILGASVYQLPLIRKVKEMGFRAIAASTTGDYPGIQEADLFLPIDTTDKEAIRASAIEHNVRAITTTGTDICVPSVGLVNDSLNLTGVDHQAALLCSDKTCMKDVLHAHNVKTAAYHYNDSPAQALRFAESIGFPVIVKPCDSSGSRGVTKVCSSDDFKAAWTGATSVSRSSTVLVEQYLDGTEFGAQAFVVGNKLEKLFLHSDTVTPPPVSTPTGHAMPYSLPPSLMEKLEAMTATAIEALGIRDSICNIDYMMVDSEPYILEVAARMGATCIPENINAYAGFDPYEYLLALALGDKPSLPTKHEMPCTPTASFLLQSDKTGIVRTIEIPESLSSRDDIVSYSVDVRPGQKVQRFVVGPDRIGHVVVKNNSVDNAVLACEEICKSIRFVIE